jgi:phosphoglycolate phosphatase
LSAPLRLAIFDLDGTIIDSRNNIVRAVADTAKVCGLTLPAAEMMPRVIGLELDEALLTLFPEVPPANIAPVRHAFGECFVRYRTESDYREPLFEGALDVFDTLSAAGFVLAIATGKARRGVDYFLDQHGLNERFVSIQTPDTAPGKPHPAMVLQAMAETGARPEGTVMIGDTTYDIAMARAAQAGAIGVSWGNHAGHELTAAGAHTLIDRMTDLHQAVDRLIVQRLGEAATAPPGPASSGETP